MFTFPFIDQKQVKIIFKLKNGKTTGVWMELALDF